MRVIHIGNMAGDSYNNVKFLRQSGIEAELVIDPRSHVTEHPEWYEGEFEGSVNEWSPDWTKVDVKGYRRPSWLHYALLSVSIRPHRLFLNLHRFNRLVRDFDIVQAAVFEPINCLLSGVKPYVSYSKGSDLRDVPFYGTIRGRIMAFAHKKAGKVFITNPDTFDSAERLDLQNTMYVPFIVDETRYAPVTSSFRNEIRHEVGSDFVVFSPSRHSWREKGNDKLIKAFHIYQSENGGRGALLLVEWGLDLQRSKQLVSQLGMQKHVHWLPIMNKHKLIQAYSAADLVFDHVNLPSYGTTPLEAMACERPVIAKLPRPDIAKRCWADDLPPLIDLDDENQILSTFQQFASDAKLRERVGKKGREWVIRHHHWKLVVQLHLDAYNEMLS